MAVVLNVLASYVKNMLMEMAKEEVHMLLGVSSEIDKMAVKLEDLKNFLADADKRNITDNSVQAWVRDLRDAMYEATDILDLCQIKAMEQGLGLEAGCFNPLLFCLRNPLHAHDIGCRIKNLNQRLEGIKNRSSAFNFVFRSYEDCSRKVTFSSPASRETSGEINELSVVGEKIEEDTRSLVEILVKGDEISCQDNKIILFAIVGVGGIGKTTLAQKIFNNEVIQQEFTKKIWLSVNKDFSETELLRRAIEAGGGHQATENSKANLEQILKKTVKGHKTLLVMDDVWDHRVWERVLQTPLANALARGSRVLITTRHDAVARGVKAKEPYHHIEKLGPEDAWSLLKNQVAGNENTMPEIDKLKSIGMGIIAKCDYLPLAVKVMGGLLRQKRKTPGDWEKVRNDTIRQMPEELNYAVYLSYEDLHPSLKQCFLHFSLLPKVLRFYSDDVVGMWISEGFVQGNSHELEELGREYYNELLLRNLIEPASPYTGQYHCSMHDLIRSFGQYVARDEVLVAHSGETDITNKLNSHKFIRLSLCKGGSESTVEWSSLNAQTSVRMLVSIRCIKAKHGDSLVTFSRLRTLHLDSINCNALVESLYQLKHLRYLSMERCGLAKLPESMGKMKFLQYIRISCNQSLAKLPDRIVELLQLRALYLTETRINIIPMGFNVLTNLRNLIDFPAHMDGEWCSLQELGPLSHLSVLGINGLENVSSSSFAKKAMLGKKLRLSQLILECTTRVGNDGELVKEEQGVSEEKKQRIAEVFDELCPPSRLESLDINGYFGRRHPRWMSSTTMPVLETLRSVEIRDLAYCTELPDRLCQLPCLEVLHIHGAPAIKCIGHKFLQYSQHHCHRSQVVAVFPRLRNLTLTGMVEWEEWEWEEQAAAMPVLETLVLEMCKLRRVPPGLAFHAKALRSLCIHNVKHLNSLENLSSVVRLHVHECPDLESIKNLRKLKKLTIYKCPKLKALEGVPTLYRLILVDWTMETLPGYLQDVKPSHLLLDNFNLSLLAAIAARETCPEWDKFSHIQHVKAYAAEDCILRKRFVLYTRDPFSFVTNVSTSDIARVLLYSTTCSVEDEWMLGQGAFADKKCEPLCLRFRWNAYRHLAGWLSRVCLHCKEAASVVSTTC